MKKLLLFFLTIFFITTSVGAFAQDSQLPEFKISPTSPFYFLKIWQEKIRTFLTFGQENKAKQFLHLSEVRLAEYKKMIEEGNFSVAEKTLEKYNQQLNKAIEIISVSKNAGDLIDSAGKAIIRDQDVLKQLLEKANDPLKSLVESAIKYTQEANINVLKVKIPELKTIGGDKDAGGCLIGAGYSWCEAKKKCIRVWEERCDGKDMDFKRIGKLSKSGEEWVLICEGTEKPALIVKVVFLKESVCNISGRANVLCSQAKLSSGDRVTITGIKEDTTVSVYELIKEISDNKEVTNNEKSMDKNIIQEEGLKIEILKEGFGDGVAAGEKPVVHYVGTLENGTKFDSSVDRGTPFSFTLGAGQVIKGWDRGILGMKVGEKRRLTIQPELGYGANGIPGAIPGNAVLIFEVELLKIEK